MSFLSGRTSLTTVNTGDISDDAITLAKMAAGTANYNILYDGSGNPTEAVAPSGGAWTFISIVTASSSSTVSFTGLTNSYAGYVVMINDLVPSGNAVDLYLRTSTDNGSSYDSASSDYEWFTARLCAATATQTHHISSVTGPTTSITCIDSAGSGTGEIVAGFVYILNPAGTLYTTIRSDLWGTQDDGYTSEGDGVGTRRSAADCDAIQFLMASGTITSGTFRLYGISPS